MLTPAKEGDIKLTANEEADAESQYILWALANPELARNPEACEAASTAARLAAIYPEWRAAFTAIRRNN